MKRFKATIISMILASTAFAQDMIVRIAEIEIHPQHLKEYLTYANEVDRLSMEREPGVICLFPMQSVEDSTQIRILEIYASEEAYRAPSGDRPFSKVQKRDAPYGEEFEIAHHATPRP